MKTSEFSYDLPEESIAQAAIEPRHEARLLDTRTMEDRRFRDLPGLLERGDVVVVNRTRVRRARLQGVKDTGGSVEILLVRALGEGRWEALVRPARRVRAGTMISFGAAAASVVEGPRQGRVVIRSDHDLGEVAQERGEVPLPPYFHGNLTSDERYQTVFAERLGSAAAPTAALHFTSAVLDGLAERGIALARIDLEVGLDTFRPIGTEHIADHRMHSEQVTVDQEACEAIEEARRTGGRVVAVGTTVVRSLESAWAGGAVRPFCGATSLFISPGYEFRAVDLVVTNFHVPGSTLVVLVAALLGERWREVYAAALGRGYRFLSFGDAMLAEVSR